MRIYHYSYPVRLSEQQRRFHVSSLCYKLVRKEAQRIQVQDIGESEDHFLDAGICFCSPANHFLLLFLPRKRALVRRFNKCWTISTRVPRMFWDDGMTILRGTQLPMVSSPFRTPFRIHRLLTRVTWSGDSSPARRRGSAPIGKWLREPR
jgi:hypothetical protein